MTFLPLGFPTATDKEEKMSKKKKQFFFSGYFLWKHETVGKNNPQPLKSELPLDGSFLALIGNSGKRETLGANLSERFHVFSVLIHT